MRHVRLIALATFFGTAALFAADPKFTSTWKWMDAAKVSFAGKKVAALVITQDQSLQVAGEEALVRELSARGLQTVATYRIVPAPELTTADKAKVWYDKQGVEGVVALRPVGKEQVRSYEPSLWMGPTYGSLWGYYGYAWSAVYIPGPARADTVITVETLVFSVPLNQLVWAGVSETKNPKQLQTFVKDLVKSTAKEMEKQGLHRRTSN